MRSFCCYHQVSDVGVQAIGTGCSSLTSLDLNYCYEVSDVGVQAIGAGCPSLIYLNLYGCDRVGDVGVQAIAYLTFSLARLLLTFLAPCLPGAFIFIQAGT